MYWKEHIFKWKSFIRRATVRIHTSTNSVHSQKYTAQHGKTSIFQCIVSQTRNTNTPHTIRVWSFSQHTRKKKITLKDLKMPSSWSLCVMVERKIYFFYSVEPQEWYRKCLLVMRRTNKSSVFIRTHAIWSRQRIVHLQTIILNGGQLHLVAKICALNAHCELAEDVPIDSRYRFTCNSSSKSQFSAGLRKSDCWLQTLILHTIQVGSSLVCNNRSEWCRADTFLCHCALRKWVLFLFCYAPTFTKRRRA